MLKGRKCKLFSLAAAATLAAPGVALAANGEWTYTGTAAGWTTPSNWLGSIPSAGGTATFRGTPGPIGAANITFSAATTLSGMYFQAYAGTNYYTISQNPGSGAATLSFNSASTLDIANGVATLSIPVVAPNFYKTGNGTLVLTGTNTFAAGVTVDGGLLRFLTSTALNGPLVVGTGATGAVELNGGSMTLLTLGSSGASGAAINTSGTTRIPGISNVGILNVHAGTVAVNGGLMTTSGSIFDSATPGDNGFTKVGVGPLVARSVVLNGPLNVLGGSLTTFQQPSPASAAGTSRVHGLTIAGGSTPTATYDLTNNITIVDTPNLASGSASHTLYMQQAGYANHNFAWDRLGIFSTTAQNDFVSSNIKSAVGIVWNNDGSGGFLGLYGDGTTYPQFHGNSVDQNSIMMMYTKVGDSDLSGSVDAADFDLFEMGYGGTAPYDSWVFGDYDYSGGTDAADFDLFQYGYSYMNPAHHAPLVLELRDFALANGLALIPPIAALVPEPATLGAIALAGLGLVRRRRR